ncbi:unnamed protein product [Macrosiphum euphorbiae]|uniref:Uncharacterized protein n=1 Tax=Macrosiphum euphorbiae TaxID=13131 RepID=A0AAV0XWS8_9HEMI|nr:unnamed protein product [Macrosiphum euphorbiae]
MQPTQISLSRPEEDLDHLFSSRAKFYGAMAAKRLKAHYYGNIGYFAKTERNVPINDVVDQIPAGSTFQRLVENCVKDLARNACITGVCTKLAGPSFDGRNSRPGNDYCK